MTPIELTLLAAIVAGMFAIHRRTLDAVQDADADFVYPSFEQNQETSAWDDVLVFSTPSTYYGTGGTDADDARNLNAFLDLIAYAEGTSGARGYQTMFGYRYFDSYADHPRQYFDYTDNAGKKLKTSAAGRYQIIVKTWDALKLKLGLVDFSPSSQDAAAIELIRERGALNDAKAGRIESAVAKCAPVWASLPGANANQPERRLSALISAYQNAGGQLA